MENEDIVKAFIYFERIAKKKDLEIHKYTEDVNKVYQYYLNQNNETKYNLDLCWELFKNNDEKSFSEKIRYYSGTIFKGEIDIICNRGTIIAKVTKSAFPDAFGFNSNVLFSIDKNIKRLNDITYIINLEMEGGYENAIKLLEEYFYVNIQNESEIEQAIMVARYERKQLAAKLEEYNNHENSKIEFIKSSNEYQKYVDFFKKNSKRELYDFQVASVKFHVDLQKTMNLSVPGSGKTTVALSTINYLMYWHLVDKVVVITKKSIIPTWIDEIKKNVSIKYNVFDNRIFNNCINIVNYEKDKQLLNFVDEFDKNTMVIFDEIHNIKNMDGKRNTNYMNLFSNSKYIIGLSGTPFPKGIEDVVAYSFLLGMSLNNLKDGKTVLHSSIKVSKEMLCLPPPKSDKIFAIEYNDAEVETYKKVLQVKKDFYSKLYYLSIISSGSKKLEKFIHKQELLNTHNDNIEIDEIGIELIQKGYSSKQSMLEDFMKSFPKNKKIIIWTKYIATIDAIEEVLSDMGLQYVSVHGSIAENQRFRNIEKFKEEDVNILLSNPACLGEGVSFHNICSDMLFYEKSLVLIEYLQAKERIHRLGINENINVQNYHFVSRHDDISESIEEYIQKKLNEKELEQNKIFNSAKIVLEDIIPIDVINAPVGNINV